MTERASNLVTPTRNKKKVDVSTFFLFVLPKATQFEPRFNPLIG